MPVEHNVWTQAVIPWLSWRIYIFKVWLLNQIVSCGRRKVMMIGMMMVVAMVIKVILALIAIHVNLHRQVVWQGRCLSNGNDTFKRKTRLSFRQKEQKSMQELSDMLC